MKAILTALIVSVIICADLQGAIHVEDPHNILQISDQFVGQVSFQEAFKCGQRAYRFRESCYQSECEEEKYHITAVYCSDEEIRFESSSDFELGVITKETFDLFKGNWLRYISRVPHNYEKSPDSERTVKFLSYSFVNKEYLGQVRTLMNISFSAEICNRDGCESSEKYHLSLASNALPSMAQMAGVRVEEIDAPHAYDIFKTIGFTEN